MADFTELTGFFTVIGSTDLPRNYSLDNNFGFDPLNPSTPLFSYSMKDVAAAFQLPRELTRVSVYNIHPDIGDTGPQEISSLTAESFENEGLTEQTDLNTTEWTDVYKVLEYLFRHQASAHLPPDSDVEASNRGDEVLNPANGESDWKVDTYWYNSLVIEPSNLNERIKVATFTMNMTANTVKFTIYFTADEFVEDYSPGRMEVYRYTDTDGDDTTISQEEFNTQIIQITMNIMKAGRYKRVDVKIVDFHDDDGITIVPEAFYVYSSFANEPSPILILQAVKDYLKVAFGNDMGALSRNYPDLFATDTVSIFPLTVNKDESHFYHPVELSVLRNELNIRGFGYDPSNSGSGEAAYKAVELFYLGSENSGDDEPAYRYPMVAIETAPDSTSNPVSTRMPQYLPIYSSYPDPSLPENWVIGGITPIDRIFHYLVYLSISLVTDTDENGTYDMAYDDPRILQIPESYTYTIDRTGSVVNFVTFVINGVLYTVLPQRL